MPLALEYWKFQIMYFWRGLGGYFFFKAKNLHANIFPSDDEKSYKWYVDTYNMN